MLAKSLKSVEWVGSSRKDMKAMPEGVLDTFGFALYLAQLGEKHPGAKPMKGFTGAGVLEMVEDYSSDTYRARLYRRVCRCCLRPARFPEEIKAWHRHTEGRDRED